MFVRAFAAAAISLAPVSSTPADYMVFVNYPLVHQVRCLEGNGTAFRLGGNHFVTVAHVASLTACKIDGKPVQNVEIDGERDFARVDGATSGYGIPINCDGFIPGHWYWAIGYAHSLPFQTAIALYATTEKDGTWRRILGGPFTLIHGMSGGPIMNEHGEAVGTVNNYYPGTPYSGSRELKDTSLCQS